MVGTNSAHDLPTVQALAPLGTFQPPGGLIGEIWAEQIDVSNAMPASTNSTRVLWHHAHPIDLAMRDSTVLIMLRGDNSEHHATRPDRLQRISLWKKRTFSGIKCPVRESSTRNTGFAVLDRLHISFPSCELRIWTNIGNVAATNFPPARAGKTRTTFPETCGVSIVFPGITAVPVWKYFRRFVERLKKSPRYALGGEEREGSIEENT